jgi:hypothetical protein
MIGAKAPRIRNALSLKTKREFAARQPAGPQYSELQIGIGPDVPLLDAIGAATTMARPNPPTNYAKVRGARACRG